MVKTKNIIALCILGSMLLMGCKKEKDTVDPIVQTPAIPKAASGYYINATVDGSLVKTIDGKNNYTISDSYTSSLGSGNAIYTSYNCSFQQLSVSNEKYFQLTFSDANIADGNDCDELPTLCTVGSYNLVDGNSPYFSLYYKGANGKLYQPDPNAASIAIQIDAVTDLGYKMIGNSNKKVVKLTGKITTARLYEYCFGNGFTSNYVDVSDLDFVIRYISAKNKL